MSTFAQNVPRLCWDSKLKKHVTCPPTTGQVASGQQPGTDPPPRRVCCLETACCLNCNDLLSIFNCWKRFVEMLTEQGTVGVNAYGPAEQQFFRVWALHSGCSQWGFGAPPPAINISPPYAIYLRNGEVLQPCYEIDTTGIIAAAFVLLPAPGSTITQCLIFRALVPECQDLGYCYEIEGIQISPTEFKYKITNVRLCTDPDAVVDTATLSACVSCVSIAPPTPPAPDTCCIPDTCCMDCDELWAIFECFKAKVEGYSVPGVPPNATTLPVYGAPGGNILQDVNTPACPIYSFHEDGEIRKNGANFSVDATCSFVYNVSNSIAVPIPPGGSVTQCFTIQSIGNLCGTFFSTPVGICFETVAVYEEILGVDTWRNQITNARLCATPLIVVASEDINDCVDCETGDVDCPGVSGVPRMTPGGGTVNTPTSLSMMAGVTIPACCGDAYILFISVTPNIANLGTFSIVGSPLQPYNDLSGLTFEGTNIGDNYQLFFEIITDNCPPVPFSHTFNII